MDDEDEQQNEVLIGGSDGYDSVVDEEPLTARERVRTCTAKLLQITNQLQIANQLQREAAEGKLGCEADRGVGQRFSSRDAFRDAVSKYAILQGRNLTYDISNTKVNQRLGVKCVEGCAFYLYGAWESRRATFVVKNMQLEHTCHKNMKRNRQLKSKWVAKQILKVSKNRPHWPAKEIVETIKRAFKVVVQRGFAYKVKYASHKMLHGSMHDHYAKVGGYIAALKASSPGSCVELVTVTKLNKQPAPPPVFQRLFTCFEGLKKGWVDGCRKVICVDGCFLKTFLGGKLLSAVGRDGNEQMYPIAWAVAEGKNNLSWEWFFEQLKNNLGLGDGEGVCIISDEHMAILNGVTNVLPKAEHRHYARHIYALWHKTYKGDELKLMFWKIAKSYNMADYKENLETLEKLDPDATNAFTAYNPRLFCRAFLDTTVKSDVITSNMAVTFNGYIINTRTKHLIYMLEEIRASLIQRLVLKRMEMHKCSSFLCPNIQKRLEKEKNKAAYCDVMPSSETLFNVSYQLDSLVGLADPGKNRIKDPYENPSKPGHLTRTGMEITCNNCQLKGHNKRRCGNPTSFASEPLTKKQATAAQPQPQHPPTEAEAQSHQ
ncbi:uncharacterized protein LOC110728656 [Chenopodium quinoa]|uniref:uncharacterized protein LOC110728656 n=1 Tax=Chenopodium quinoa TaxID=63459 RepID=UPI000B77C3DB|nr:uncharacterized protein LOC110728656 [Chenopodium quinoa]